MKRKKAVFSRTGLFLATGLVLLANCAGGSGGLYGTGSEYAHGNVAGAFRQAVRNEMGDRFEVSMEPFHHGQAGLIAQNDIHMFRVTCLAADNSTPAAVFYITDRLAVSWTFTLSQPPKIVLCAITPQSMIWEPSTGTAMSGNPARAREIFFRTTNVRYYSEKIREGIPSRLPAGFRPLSFEEYREYASFTIPVPDSTIPDDRVLSGLVPGKVILAVTVPDAGPVNCRIIMPVPVEVAGTFPKPVETPFGDYQPKTSADTATDYRPGFNKVMAQVLAAGCITRKNPRQ